MSTPQFKDRKLEEETELMTSWHWLINVLVRKLKMDCDPKQRSFRHSMHKDFWRKSYCLFHYLRYQALVEKSKLEPYFSHNRFSKCSNHTVTIPGFFSSWRNNEILITFHYIHGLLLILWEKIKALAFKYCTRILRILKITTKYYVHFWKPSLQISGNAKINLSISFICYQFPYMSSKKE